MQRGIEIISEASKGIPETLKDTRPEIPWRTIGNAGNVLRHEYHRIVDTVIWAVVTDDLPKLHDAIAAMLADLDKPKERRSRRGIRRYLSASAFISR